MSRVSSSCPCVNLVIRLAPAYFTISYLPEENLCLGEEYARWSMQALTILFCISCYYTQVQIPSTIEGVQGAVACFCTSVKTLLNHAVPEDCVTLTFHSDLKYG